MAAQRKVRSARNIQPGNEPLPSEVAIAETLAERLAMRVLLRGSNVPGGDALLTTATGRRFRAEFKTLHSASTRALERNVREASRQTGKYPGVVVIDARAVGLAVTDAEAYIDRALGLIAPRRPKLHEVMIITYERIIHRQLAR